MPACATQEAIVVAAPSGPVVAAAAAAAAEDPDPAAPGPARNGPPRAPGSTLAFLLLLVTRVIDYSVFGILFGEKHLGQLLYIISFLLDCTVETMDYSNLSLVF